MSVAPNKIFSSTFSLLYNLLNSQVTDPIAASRNKTQGSSKWIFASFPDADITDAKIKYPILIIEPANSSFLNWTFTKNIANMMLGFTVYSLSMEQADSAFDACVSTMDAQRPYLKANGLTQLILTGTTSDFIAHNGTKVHFRSATYTAQFYFKHGLSKKTETATLSSGGEIV
jgi:hypothetical protein